MIVLEFLRLGNAELSNVIFLLYFLSYNVNISKSFIPRNKAPSIENLFVFTKLLKQGPQILR